MLKGSTKMAVHRVKDRMRSGAKLMQMRTPTGKKWYVVPGREVDEEIAKKVIAEPDVFPVERWAVPWYHANLQPWLGQLVLRINGHAGAVRPS